MQPIPRDFDAHAFFLRELAETTPQKSDELSRLVARYNIRFNLDQKSASIDFWSVPSTGQINVPRSCLFRLRANAYAYYSSASGMLARRAGTADPELDDRLNKAGELLTWAVRTDVATSLDDGSEFSLGRVPDGYELLCQSCVTHAQRDHAEQVFRFAVAWILHHEIAHVRLQHPDAPGSNAVQEEWEADRAATDWLLDVQELTPAERLARFYGVTVGLGWIAALRVYLGGTPSASHPPLGQRFLQGIDYMTRRAGDESELPWAICQMVLFLHARNAGVPVESLSPVGSFKDAAQALLHLIEQAKP